MGVKGFPSVVKYLLVIFNAIFFLVGIAILGIGIWLKVEREDFEDISRFDYVTPSIIAIAVGAIMLVVAFMGCIGALTENTCLLLAHFVLSLLIFVLQIVACALAYVNRSRVEKQLEGDFRLSIKEKYSVNDAVTKVIDNFQKEFECCGFNDYADWIGSIYNNKTGSIPKSCCLKDKKEDPLCGANKAGAFNVYNKKGCFKEVLDFLKENLLLVAAFATGVAIIQLVGMGLTLYLYIEVARDKRGILA